MQACKIKKLTAAVMLLCGTSVFLAAQSVEMPTMPEMPSMPTVTMDGTFYTPTFPQTTTSKSSSSTAATSTDTGTETVLTDGTSTTDVFSSLLTGSSTLTASDISILYDSGLFSTLSGLSSASASTYSTSTSTNVLLQQVLNSLNELKTQQKNATPAEKEVLQNTQTDSETFKQREPSILRFKINGYNITDSLTKVFFSEPEPDGTFLLTADRRYYANQKTLTETFYMYFKTVSNAGTSVSYKVQPAIVQDTKNENSFVYKLMSHKNLTAEKTGNLVVLHLNDSDLTADMLLDIDKK